MISLELSRTLQGSSGPIYLHATMAVEKGQLVALYGPSGAGKTSILRMIAGVFAPEAGKITVDGVTWFDRERRILLKPQQRSVGIVFQDYALFPNMSVWENICFGLQRNEPRNIAEELVEMMELDQLRSTMPHMLSGGQRQRVALARAIVRKPAVLLLDEPLAALDTALRLRMQEYILTVHRKYGLTTILVSHDILEVLKLSDKVFVLENGRIIREGAPSTAMPVQALKDMQHTLDHYLQRE